MRLFSLFILLLATTAVYGEDPTLAEIDRHIAQEYPSLEKLYHHLHSHPELSFGEEKTAKRIAQELGELGFAVTENVGGHGIVAVLKNGEGPTLLVRTDLDALPIKEKTGLSYASKVVTKDKDGNDVAVMHACGHDVHMTVLVGTARLLKHLQDQWQGTLMMIGQPAEEMGAGAKRMLDDGLFTRFPRPDYCIALHVKSDLVAGKISYRPGFAMANVDSVDITVYGVGGHGAYPHGTKDPVVIAAQLVLSLQTIVSREISPLEPAVVTVGSIHGGTKHNIIPDRVHLQLTVRSYKDSVREKILAAIERIAKHTARTAGLPEDKMPTVTVDDDFTPAVYNDPALAEKLAQVFRQTLGEDNVVLYEQVMGGEDFSQYGRVAPKIPICMFFLGSVDPQTIAAGKALPSLHSPFYYPLPEPTIRTGVKGMTAAALHLLGK